MIWLQLFLTFAWIAALSVGGGYAALPLLRHQVVELRGWLSMTDFSALVALAEMTPGPLAINSATFVGLRMGGAGGAAAATLGCVLPSCILASLMGRAYDRWCGTPLLRRAMACLRAAVAALVLSAGLSMLRLSWQGSGWEGAALFALAMLLLRRFHWKGPAVMGLCAALGLLLGLAGA